MGQLDKDITININSWVTIKKESLQSNSKIGPNMDFVLYRSNMMVKW